LDLQSKLFSLSLTSFQFSFCNFYFDDHLTTVMFLDQGRRTLDLNFLLWKFNTSELDHRALKRLDGKEPPKQVQEDDNIWDMPKMNMCNIF
jgi:hypothetical protein